ncbi:MAG: hypothetical protein KC516_04395 [Nanoarchaeota archaeon]|nr:hypothetical protein [Nanoarchaeota archaeon]
MKTKQITKQYIKDLEWINFKTEGKRLKYDLGNRLYGALGIALSTIFYFGSNKDPLTYIMAPLAIEGLSDLIQGKHHSLAYRLLKLHPKYKLEKIKLENKALWEEAVLELREESPDFYNEHATKHL